MPSPPARTSPVVRWPDEVDSILGGDVVAAVGCPTPDGGVEVEVVTPLGMRDRELGTVSFLTSLGRGRELDRIVADPRIALAYHTRRHGHAEEDGYVLVQGRATVRGLSEQQRVDLGERVAAHLGRTVRRGRFWSWWLEAREHDRLVVVVRVQRLLWWPGEEPGGEAIVLGTPLPREPLPSQPPPDDPIRARVSVRKLRRTVRHRHRILGVVQADGMPLLTPVEVTNVSSGGLRLTSSADLLPQGQRRSGLLTHDHRAGLRGQSLTSSTGWLRVVGDLVKWTPHSHTASTAPSNEHLLLLREGLAARRGHRAALERGRDEELRRSTVYRDAGGGEASEGTAPPD